MELVEVDRDVLVLCEVDEVEMLVLVLWDVLEVDVDLEVLVDVELVEILLLVLEVLVV